MPFARPDMKSHKIQRWMPLHEYNTHSNLKRSPHFAINGLLLYKQNHSSLVVASPRGNKSWWWGVPWCVSPPPTRFPVRERLCGLCAGVSANLMWLPRSIEKNSPKHHEVYGVLLFPDLLILYVKITQKEEKPKATVMLPNNAVFSFCRVFKEKQSTAAHNIPPRRLYFPSSAIRDIAHLPAKAVPFAWRCRVKRGLLDSISVKPAYR